MPYKVHAGPVELPNPLMVEGLAGATFLPGTIVTKSGDDLNAGAADTLGALLFAKEYGPGQGGHIDDPFVVGEPMAAYNARQGLFFRARLDTGLALVKDETLLARGADGLLVLATGGNQVAVAKETLTTTAVGQLALVEAL